MAISTVNTRDMHNRDMLKTLTDGRPFIFVIMSYQADRCFLFDCITELTKKQFNLACIRADQMVNAGYDLLEKIHYCIEHAELIIAEISEWSPNVFYEIGYAVGIDKPPVLVMEKREKFELPTDLRGLEVIEYRNEMGKQGVFERDLAEHLRFRLNSELAVIRDMLQAQQPVPSYIVASPKENPLLKGHVYDFRTFGDHLGILGLLSAFGSMWGEMKGVELISAQYAPEDLEQRDLNLYLIGSGRSNPVTGRLLPRLQGAGAPLWSFRPVNESDADGSVMLCRNGESFIGEQGLDRSGTEKVWLSDYGLVLRAPHPDFPDKRIMLVTAGAHSLGTGAACLAATRSSLIQKIRARLPEKKMEDKSSAIWALVKGSVGRDDYLLDEDGVEIVDAGVYE